MPAWPVVLAGLGSMQFREHAGAGTVDVLVCALVTTLLALYFGLRRWHVVGPARGPGARRGGLRCHLHQVDRRRRAPAAVASRPGLAARSARFCRSGQRRSPDPSVMRSPSPRSGCCPSSSNRAISELRIGRWEPDPFEVNISLRQIPTLLSTDANLVYRGGDAGVRAGLVQLRFWNSYDVPATLRSVFTAVSRRVPGRVARVVVRPGDAAGARRVWRGLAVLVVVRSAQHLRPACRCSRLTASFGAAWLWRARPQLLWPNAIAAGGGAVSDPRRRRSAQGCAGPDRVVFGGHRGDAGAAGAPRGDARRRCRTRSRSSIRSWIATTGSSPALAGRTDAAHVLVTYPLFRFFERGAHALSLWPYERVQPGDVFASHEYHAPPDDPRWVLVARLPPNRVWLRRRRAPAGHDAGESVLDRDDEPSAL